MTAINISGSSSGPVWNYKVKPNPLTNLTDAVTSTNQIDLGWTLSSDEPGSIDGYDVYYANGTLIGSVNKGTNNTPFPD